MIYGGCAHEVFGQSFLKKFKQYSNLESMLNICAIQLSHDPYWHFQGVVDKMKQHIVPY